MAEAEGETRDSGGRPARRARLEGRLNLPRSMAPFGLAIAVLALSYFAVSSTPKLPKLLVSWLAVVAILLSVACAWSGRRWVLVFLLLVVAGMGVLFRQNFPPDPYTLVTHVVGFSFLGYVVGAAALVVLCALPFIEPAKAGALIFSGTTALVIGNAFMEKMGEQPLDSVAAVATPAAAAPQEDLSVIVPNELVWAGQPTQPHDIIEYTYTPNVTFKNFYPSNPRGYFEPEPVYGPIDMRMGTLSLAGGSRGIVKQPKEPKGVVRVEPAKLTGDGSWSLGLQYHTIPVLADRPYLVRFRARADRARTMDLELLNRHDKYQRLCPLASVQLSEEWREFADVAVPKAGTKDSVLTFKLGNDTAPVEITNLSVVPGSRMLDGWVDMRNWRLHESKAAKGVLQLPQEDHGSVRLEIQRPEGAKPWDLQLNHDLFELKEGASYYGVVRARADRPRSFNIVAVAPKRSWANLGLGWNIEATPEWRYHGVQFKATADEREGILAVNAGENDAPIEFADMRLWVEPSAADTPSPVHYGVTYKLNGDGFRDRDHALEREGAVVRIACLGDSFTFGQGVHEPDTFTRRLERILNEERQVSEPRYEVFNYGVCGYSTKQERQSFELFAAKYKPDVVVVTMVHNDNLSYKEEEELGMHAPPATGRLVGSLQQQINWLKNDEVGYEVCVTELKTLDGLCRGQGARLAAVIFQNDDKGDNWKKMVATVTEGLASTEIPLMNLKDALCPLPFGVQRVHPVDPHPNNIAHAIAAREIAAFLKSKGLLSPASLARRP